MTVIDRPVQTRSFPTAIRPDDAKFVGLAADIGAVAAAHAAEHDRDATFVSEAYAVMRERGYLALSVPEELGGLGATMRQVLYAQAELARHDGATGLASAMHQYLTLMQGFRRRKGAPDAEGVLRRVAAEGIVIATSGGSDWLWPTTTAVAVDGGFRVSGRKAFCSQSPAATVVATSAVLGDEVLHFSVPFAADGVRIEETWDTLGMRGTASHDVVLEDVFVPADKIAGRRPYGEFGVPLMAAAIHFAPVVGATYFGIAAAARDVAVAGANPQAQRQIGLMDSHLRTAWWSLMGAVEELGDDYGLEPSTLATVMLAKRHAVISAIAVVDLAMDIMGGRSFFRRFPLERAYRDVRAGRFHPLTPEVTLNYVGKLTLGDSGVTQ
ncbi:acyl-CoA dehydrogenase [Actinokineospora alba]|uniref:Acyl-CoA dehydrogenase n=1 Tax=Actinokineospora alba TaxID=504798 RepID=A0A1H0VIF1_9PSEU|nr:acyl-CoA dehydrogenase family protein [Actinokineospora alba]TDP67707.1 acyl-CoA dehydrogenase [Actinokineospora alba]SDJ27815.1 acyl-CoA dehydrogenase [Actinokineospora alba]SDP78101.1 acyl-CoA dehydrogenase [Actinokineospora alba]